MSSRIVLHDTALSAWLEFSEAEEIISCQNHSEILPSLAHIEKRVEGEGLYAAGFLSYEAAKAFDKDLTVKPNDGFPLLWFGLYRQPQFRKALSQSSRTQELSWRPSIGREEYDLAIHRIKSLIASGDTYQVNYTMRMLAKIAPDFDSWEYFLDLLQAQPAGYGAYIDIVDHTICSVSPELFFLRDDSKLLSRPMKGTVARACTTSSDSRAADWLWHSEKNRAENVMIVDMMRNDFGKIAESGSVNVPSLFAIERYPTVWQMTSDVTAKTRASLTEILKAIFPAASITGAPKSRTMKIIADLETSPRKIYCGAIGYVAPGHKAQFSVAIRTVMIDKKSHTAEYGVGGGIVWDSEASAEYDECLAKAQVLSEQQSEFSLLETMLWTPDQGYFLLEYHLRRLADSAYYFDFPLSDHEVRNALENLAVRLQDRTRVRLLASRQGEVRLESSTIAADAFNRVVRLRMATQAIDSSNRYLYHKTTSRSIYDRSKEPRTDCDDVILWNVRNEVTETTIYNIVILREDGIWVTPPIHSGLLAGTFRQYLLDIGKIKEDIILVTELRQARQIAVINSVRGWQEALLVSHDVIDDVIEDSVVLSSSTRTRE